MIHECIKCKEDFLTEADPFIVFPKPSGSEFQCLRCYQQREDKLIEALKFYADTESWDWVMNPLLSRLLKVEDYEDFGEGRAIAGKKAREVLKELEIEL